MPLQDETLAPQTQSIRLSAAKPSEPSSFYRFLAYLVFEGHGLRVGLELSACIILYTLSNAFIPWETLGVPAKWITLISWFGCCFLIISLDQIVLCKPVYTLRTAYHFFLAGAYERALELLESVGPEGRAAIKLPSPMYHLFRAEVLTQAERFSSAEHELTLAERHGVKQDLLAIHRSRLELQRGLPETAKSQLEASIASLGANPQLEVEKAFLQFSTNAPAWELKRTCKEVMNAPDGPHFSGESCFQLAKALFNVSRLKTGEAEEGLEGLGYSIERLRSAIGYVDTLRPLLSRLLLERAHYYATHKEPDGAIVDLGAALALCNFPEHRARAQDVKEELEFRYLLVLP